MTTEIKSIVKREMKLKLNKKILLKNNSVQYDK